MTTETWYVLDDGELGDPEEIGYDANSILRHKDGRAVAYGPHGPLSRGDVNGAAERAKAKRHKVRDMKPEEPKRGYKTRESKVDR